MTKFEVKSKRNAALLVALSIITKREIEMYGSGSEFGEEFIAAITRVSPGTKFSFQDEAAVRVNPGVYCGGKVAINIRGCRPTHPLLELLLLLGIYGKEDLTIQVSGITNFGDPLDFVYKIHSQIFSLFGLKEPKVAIKKRGFGPMGDGIFNINVPVAREIQPICLEDEESLEWIDVLVITARVSANYLERAATKIKEMLGSIAPVKIHSFVHNSKDSGPSPGTECTLVAKGDKALFYALSLQNDTPENIAEACCNDLIESIGRGGNIDPKLLSLTFLLMALARGVSYIKCCQLSDEHIEILQALSKLLMTEYTVHTKDDGDTVIIVGIGFINPFMYI